MMRPWMKPATAEQMAKIGTSEHLTREELAEYAFYAKVDQYLFHEGIRINSHVMKCEGCRKLWELIMLLPEFVGVNKAEFDLLTRVIDTAIEVGAIGAAVSNDKEVNMKKRQAFFSNHFFLLDDDDKIVGVECNDERIMLGDRVAVNHDGCGFVGYGITKEGLGTIVDFTDTFTDHYFIVQMDNGQHGYLKRARITKVPTAAAV